MPKYVPCNTFVCGPQIQKEITIEKRKYVQWNGEQVTCKILWQIKKSNYIL